MSIITVLSSGSAPANITLNESVNNTTTITPLTGGTTSIITIDQGLQGLPGPQGPPGSGFIDIIAGSGISVISQSGVYTISSLIINNLSTSDTPYTNNGRLTLQSGDPVYLNNITGSILYFTPYLGNYISLYNTVSNTWEINEFNEISLNLSGMTIDTNYDIFIYDNGSSIVLEKVSWLNNSTRTINLIYQDGVLVKSGSLNKRYIGTIRSTGSFTTEDSESRRFVYNYSNKIFKILTASDAISHTYTSGIVRPYRNITTTGTTRNEFICGVNSTINLICNSVFATETSSSSVGIGVDTTTTFNTKSTNTTSISSTTALILTNNSYDVISVNPGYHYLQLLQSGSSITTFYNSALKAIIEC